MRTRHRADWGNPYQRNLPRALLGVAVNQCVRISGHLGAERAGDRDLHRQRGRVNQLHATAGDICGLRWVYRVVAGAFDDRGAVAVFRRIQSRFYDLSDDRALSVAALRVRLADLIAGHFCVFGSHDARGFLAQVDSVPIGVHLGTGEQQARPGQESCVTREGQDQSSPQ